MVLAAVAAPDAPGLEGAAAEAAPASRGGSGAPSPASEARRGPTPPGPAPARERSSALHALLDGLSRGAAPAARVEVEGAGLGATVRGVRAAVAVIARAGKVTVALESGPGRPPGR